MPDAEKSSPEFLRAWTDAMEGTQTPKNRRKPRSGTIAAGIQAYMASDHFLSLAKTTRANWRGPLEDMKTRYGAGKLRDLMARHIRQDLARLAANPANNRRKIWRALGRFWLDHGLIESDPTQEVRKRPVAATTGHTPWTADDAALFRAHWPVDTMQRLAFELLLHTGAARRDVVALGRKNIDADGYLTYTRSKSGSRAVVPWTCAAPSWFETNPDLFHCIELAPKHLTFLSTKAGASRSDKAFGTWFVQAARAAGISPGKTAHGVRKLRSVMMAESGATPDQRMAILGHETEAEARHYSKSANLKTIISGTDFSNSVKQVGKKTK